MYFPAQQRRNSLSLSHTHLRKATTSIIPNLLEHILESAEVCHAIAASSSSRPSPIQLKAATTRHGETRGPQKHNQFLNNEIATLALQYAQTLDDHTHAALPLPLPPPKKGLTTRIQRVPSYKPRGSANLVYPARPKALPAPLL